MPSKLRRSRNHTHDKIPVLQLDKKTGEVLERFSSLTDAGRMVAGDDGAREVVAHIVDVCKGRHKSAYGYRWVYECDYHESP